MTWFNDTVMEAGFVKGLGQLGVKFSSLNGVLDKNIVDGLVNLVATLVQVVGIFFRKLQTGRVQTYVALLLVAVVGYFFAKMI
jgi:NADH-quinone oxidoreductase subunit L